MNTKETPAASASRHTPELQLPPVTYERGCLRSPSDNDSVALLTFRLGDEKHREKQHRNGPWVASAINACAGIADPAAEIGELRREHARLAEFSGQAAAEIAALRQALEFLLHELNPDIAIETAVAQEPYDNRRDRRAALLVGLRKARAALRLTNPTAADTVRE